MSWIDDENMLQKMLEQLDNAERAKSQRSSSPKKTEKTLDKLQFGERFTLRGEQFAKMSNRHADNLTTGERVFISPNQIVTAFKDGTFYPNGKPVEPELLEV